jgi:hypothetical protein
LPIGVHVEVGTCSISCVAIATTWPLLPSLLAQSEPATSGLAIVCVAEHSSVGEPAGDPVVANPVARLWRRAGAKAIAREMRAFRAKEGRAGTDEDAR